MNIPMEEKKQEAIARMQKLGIYEPIIRDFAERGIVSISEKPIGAYYYADEQQTAVIRRAEKNGILIYTGIRSYTNYGVIDAFLFVGDYKDEWPDETESMKDGYAMAYVYNYDMECTDIGSIRFKRTDAAGLVRIL